MTPAKFRFQDLEVWKDAVILCDTLFDVADDLEARKWYRFADQVRSAGLSVSNNIAEGAGADSRPDFIRFLGYARRSVFENASMILILFRRGIITTGVRDSMLISLDSLSRRIASLQKSLKR